MVRVGWQDVAPSDPRCVLRARGLGQRALQPHASPYRPGNNVGGCQNYGPFLGTLNIKCRITIGIQKETIILTATHMGVSQNRGPHAVSGDYDGPYRASFRGSQTAGFTMFRSISEKCCKPSVLHKIAAAADRFRIHYTIATEVTSAHNCSWGRSCTKVLGFGV